MPERRAWELYKECVSPSLVWRAFVRLLQVGILGEISGEGLDRIVIRLPGVSFNMLIRQYECIEGSGSFSGQYHL